MESVAEGFRRAAEKVGPERVRRAGHRLEHAEMPAPEVIATMADLGITASVQPMFDALWGGPTQMYAERVGSRWQQLNVFADLASAGVPLAFGSDSPVTEIGPWAAVRAAVHHRTETQRLPVPAAHRAHTWGGWAAGGQPGRGRLAPGQPADLAAWRLPAGADDDRFPVLAPDADLPELLFTMAAGRIIHREDF